MIIIDKSLIVHIVAVIIKKILDEILSSLVRNYFI